MHTCSRAPAPCPLPPRSGLASRSSAVWDFLTASPRFVLPQHSGRRREQNQARLAGPEASMSAPAPGALPTARRHHTLVGHLGCAGLPWVSSRRSPSCVHSHIHSILQSFSKQLPRPLRAPGPAGRAQGLRGARTLSPPGKWRQHFPKPSSRGHGDLCWRRGCQRLEGREVGGLTVPARCTHGLWPP